MGIQKRIGLVAQGIFADLSRRHHHMRMVIANIAGVMRRMDREIHRCAIAIGQILRERARRLQPPLRRQLMRKRDLELTADTRVLALFRKLRRIPQGRTVQSPIGGNAWPRKDDLASSTPSFRVKSCTNPSRSYRVQCRDQQRPWRATRPDFVQPGVVFPATGTRPEHMATVEDPHLLPEAKELAAADSGWSAVAPPSAAVARDLPCHFGLGQRRRTKPTARAACPVVCSRVPLLRIPRRQSERSGRCLGGG